jgi:predicted N-formylglutamate amidohydrolase
MEKLSGRGGLARCRHSRHFGRLLHSRMPAIYNIKHACDMHFPGQKSLALTAQAPMSTLPKALLAADEPAPVTVRHPDGASPFLLVADHAGNAMPRALDRLGVAPAELERHIALDIGIGGVALLLADALDATLIQQNYSRLVIDCNRPLDSPTSIPELSEITPIPGNVGLSATDKAARAAVIFWPYHRRIETELDRRRKTGRPAALIALHSFTPRFKDAVRPWHAALLYHRDPSLAHRLIALLKEEQGLIVGDNAPYLVSDATDYTIPVHGERRGLPHALIEIRQDLIADARGQESWARRLARLLPQALEPRDDLQDRS